MFGHKIIFIISLLISIGCANRELGLQHEYDKCRILCTTPGDSCLYVSVLEDYDKSETHLYIISSQDTLDEYTLNSAYDKASIEIINDTLIELSYPVRGGYGMRRKAKSIFYIENYRIKRLFEIYAYEEFKDKTFNVPHHLLNCDYEMANDTVYFEQKIYENDQLIESRKKMYSIIDLKMGKDSVDVYL